ncbi:MAG: calycin-like domain-containing protein [Bacteroidaceae bacterium]|nr:calycin-like domain-containing protein [Bacteroidaceae bacterium]
MKKTLLTFAFALTAVFAMAQTTITYTDSLFVDVNNDPMMQEATIIVEQNANGTYTMSLNNLILGGFMPVGNIVLDNVAVTEENRIMSFAVERNINITAGEGDEEWIGPELGEVPVKMTGKMDSAHLYCTIDIDMSEAMGMPMIVKVVFGNESNVTSIENIACEQGSKTIFDITGRRIEAVTTPGIYIINGKKVLVK